MIDYDARPERAVLVAVLAQGADEERELAEMLELLRTAQVDVVGTLVQHRASIHPRTYVGSGKLKELKELAKELEAEVIVTEDELSPSQQRTLEDELAHARRRPHPRDPRHLRAARPLGGGQAPGRARAAGVQPPAHARHVEAPRAAGRRRRHARPGRVAARDRPPAGAHAHLAAPPSPARAAQAARDDAPPARAQRGAERRARRLHERRQVDAPERADRRRACRRPTACSRRSTRRRAPTTTSGARTS